MIDDSYPMQYSSREFLRMSMRAGSPIIVAAQPGRPTTEVQDNRKSFGIFILHSPRTRLSDLMDGGWSTVVQVHCASGYVHICWLVRVICYYLGVVATQLSSATSICHLVHRLWDVSISNRHGCLGSFRFCKRWGTHVSASNCKRFSSIPD